MILPMGHIPDYSKATDEQIAQEIAFCRSVLQLLQSALEAGVGVETSSGFIFKERLAAAEEELERRFLLS